MKMLAIDGNSVFYRAFYGVRLLTTKDGICTNAIYGFLNILLKEMEINHPDRILVAFDLPEPTFRHLEYNEYKAGRKPSPDELRMQMPIIQEILPLMGITVVTCKGYEADDILGTISLLCEKQGDECVILTGDRDSLQLISEKTTVRLASTKAGTPSSVVYDKEKLKEEYGVDDPLQMIEIKALMGDPSDNLPGVAGIGPKSACALIQSYGSMSYIYSHLDTIEVTNSIRAKLEKGKDNAYLSHKMAIICRTAPIEQDLSAYDITPTDKTKLADMLTRLELRTLLKRLNLDAIPSSETQNPVPPVTQTVDKDVVYAESDDFLELLDKSPVLPLWDEEKRILTVATEDTVYQMENGEDTYQKVLETFPVIALDAKKIYHYGFAHNLSIHNVVFCLTLASYLIHPESSDYSASALCSLHSLDCQTADAMAGSLYHLEAILRNQIAKLGLEKVLFEIELPLAEVLASMERLGIAIDREGIESYGEMLTDKLTQLESKIYEEAGMQFNINSPKQLGQVLFDVLHLPPKKKTKSGYSTNAEVLEELAALHPVPSMIVEYRTLSKLKSTYVDSLLKLQKEDGRIHSTFIQTVTRTGRISSADPNLQNIPIRNQLGGELRRFFVAKEGAQFIDADYSQIELRVLAHMADDKNMQSAFSQGVDIHTKTASEMFHMPLDMVTPLIRSRAKAINFGIVYGMGAFSLAKDTGVSMAEATEYIKEYFHTYGSVKAFLEKTVQEAHETATVSTLFGRIRNIPEIKQKNKALAAVGERMAKNTPIQGTAADIIKIAMIRVYHRLKKENMEAKLILQVHDELIVEAPEHEVAHASQLLREEMENAVHLSVPLLTDLHTGSNWLEAK